MLTRRDLLQRTVQGSTLLALGSSVPHFIANTARAAEADQENVLVVVEMTGGNDGLNMVAPYADDLYHKARPTLALKERDVLKVNDHIGLHPSLTAMHAMLDDGGLAIVQGVGYPNPNRSHFESMDFWHTGDPTGKTSNGWLARAMADINVTGGKIPAFHLGRTQLPLALQGSATGVPSLNPEKPFGLDLIGQFHGHQPDRRNAQQQATDKTGRQQLIADLAEKSPNTGPGMLQFVRRTSLDAYASIDRLQEIMSQKFRLPDARGDFSEGRYREIRSGLTYELLLTARMIQAGFGTRIFYLSFDGFDTHSQQAAAHQRLMSTLNEAVSAFFTELKGSGDDKRVILMTFSEFGRRVAENGSKGTDHGAGSCMFLAGPSVKAGSVNEHPKLDDLDSGDLKHQIDFRQIYATLLDRWLGCESRHVLGEQFPHAAILA